MGILLMTLLQQPDPALPLQSQQAHLLKRLPGYLKYPAYLWKPLQQQEPASRQSLMIWQPRSPLMQRGVADGGMLV